MNNHFFKIFILIISLFLLLSYTTKKITYDWDLPAYVGCIFQLDGYNDADVHQKTYQLLKIKASKADYYHITFSEASGYRQSMSVDSHYFRQQLPYYQVKVLYLGVVQFLTLFNINSIDAIYLINFGSIFLLGILMFYVLNTGYEMAFFTSLAITLAIIYGFQLLELYQNASPDLLSSLLFVTVFWSVIANKNFWFQMFLLSLLILVRPDSIVFSLLFIIFSGYVHSVKSVAVLMAIITSFLLYFSIVKFFHYPGWGDLFYDSFIERRIDLADKADFTWSTYLKITLNQLLNFKKISAVLILLLFINVAKSYFFGLPKKYLLLSLLLVTCTFVKFLLFPSVEIRFHLPFILLLILIAVKPSDKNGFVFFKPLWARAIR